MEMQDTDDICIKYAIKWEKGTSYCNIRYSDLPKDLIRGWDPFRPTGGFVLLPPLARGRITHVYSSPRVADEPYPGL